MHRGDVWWIRSRAHDKSRPVVLVSRDEAYARRQFVVVAPVTRRVREIGAEVQLGEAEGLRGPSVVNCDVLETVSKDLLSERIGAMRGEKLAALDGALKFALGLD